MPQKVTMADVAREAGVSMMTVSRAINDREGISEATRQRILAIVDRLGYRPSDIARSLATDRTSTIGLVVPDISNPFFSKIAHGVEQIAYAEGYSVFMCNTNENIDREIEVLRSLETKRVDGLIVCSSRLYEDELQAALKNHPNVVLINRTLPEIITGTVVIADVEGGKLATSHLLKSGHRAIGYLASTERSHSSKLRFTGYQCALEAADIPYRPDWMRHCLPMSEAGKQAAIKLLQEASSELTALQCSNDLVAVGALQACTELGYAVPDDIAILGFDDIYLASLVTPPLSTCRVPIATMGQQAMQLLLDHINDCTDDCNDVVVQPELIVRASAP